MHFLPSTLFRWKSLKRIVKRRSMVLMKVKVKEKTKIMKKKIEVIKILKS